jgi:hypothetical protein
VQTKQLFALLQSPLKITHFARFRHGQCLRALSCAPAYSRRPVAPLARSERHPAQRAARPKLVGPRRVSSHRTGALGSQRREASRLPAPAQDRPKRPGVGMRRIHAGHSPGFPSLAGWRLSASANRSHVQSFRASYGLPAPDVVNGSVQYSLTFHLP